MLNIISYSKRPSYLKTKPLHVLQFLQLLFITIAVCIALNTVSDNLFEVKRAGTNLTLQHLLVIGVLIMPFIEEFLFRFLLKPKYINFLIYAGFCLIISLYFIFSDKIKLAVLFTLLGIGISYLLFFNRKLFRIIQVKLMRKYSLFYYISIFSFAFLHLVNIKEINIYTIIVSPFLLLPQIIGGIVLSYIRVYYGFIYSVIFHSLYNLLSILVYLLIDEII